MHAKQKTIQIFLKEYFPILLRLTNLVVFKSRREESEGREKVCVYEEESYHFYLYLPSSVHLWVGAVGIGEWSDGREREVILHWFGIPSSLRFSWWDEEVEERVRRRMNFFLSCVVARLVAHVAQKLGVTQRGNEIITENLEMRLDCSLGEVVVRWKPKGAERFKCLSLPVDWNEGRKVIDKIASLLAVSLL